MFKIFLTRLSSEEHVFRCNLGENFINDLHEKMMLKKLYVNVYYEEAISSRRNEVIALVTKL